MLHPGRQLSASFHELVGESYCQYYDRPANETELLFRLLFIDSIQPLL